MSTLLALALLLSPDALAHDLSHEVAGSGTPATESRAIPGVTRVASALPVPVVITADGQEQVEVTCDDNLTHLIESEVDGAVLELRLPAHTQIRPAAACSVAVSVGRLQALSVAGSGSAWLRGEMTGVEVLTVAGSGELRGEAVRGATLALTVSGSGDVILAGSAQELVVDVAGSGDIDAVGVTAGRARVAIAGSGDVALSARDAVDVSIVGSGDVRVHGTGVEVRETVLGSGDVTVVGTEG